VFTSEYLHGSGYTGEPSIITGTWEIERDEKKEFILFSPFMPGVGILVKRDDNLVNRFKGTTYVKQ
jgi:hypothetical protein